MSHRLRRVSLTAAVATVLLTACQTGERPSFEDERPQQELLSTGNAAIDLVLDRLDSVDEASFTAEYDIETKFGSLSSTGSVVQTDDDRRSITIEAPSATTRFLTTDAGEQTCNLATTECESSINDARISDVSVPHDFYGPSFARRLRVSADRRIGVDASYTKPIAGQDARCVDVDVAGGTETFCALDSGVLAQFIGADVTIDLTAYASEADTTQLASS